MNTLQFEYPKEWVDSLYLNLNQKYYERTSNAQFWYDPKGQTGAALANVNHNPASIYFGYYYCEKGSSNKQAFTQIQANIKQIYQGITANCGMATIGNIGVNSEVNWFCRHILNVFEAYLQWCGRSYLLASDTTRSPHWMCYTDGWKVIDKFKNANTAATCYIFGKDLNKSYYPNYDFRI